MSDELNPCVLPDGCIQCGPTVIEPWPSLRMIPVRVLTCTEQIVWAKPGDALWRFTERIPLPLLEVVKTVSGCSWELLELAASSPKRGPEMIVSCPALAVLIVSSLPPHQNDRLDQLGTLLRMRWREILIELGLPNEPRVLRILRKMPLEHCHRLTVGCLADAIRSRHPHLRMLTHLPKITRDTIGLLRHAPEKINAHLFLASSASDYNEERVTWIVDTITWFRDQERAGRPWPYGHLTAEGLARVEETFRVRYGDGSEHLTPFPEPPISGVPGRITALRDFAAVVAEGDEQVNCAESYIPDILVGKCYIYSVKVLETATLALRRTADGAWVVDDVRARNNQPPSRETVAYVEEWLRRENTVPHT